MPLKRVDERTWYPKADQIIDLLDDEWDYLQTLEHSTQSQVRKAIKLA